MCLPQRSTRSSAQSQRHGGKTNAVQGSNQLWDTFPSLGPLVQGEAAPQLTRAPQRPKTRLHVGEHRPSPKGPVQTLPRSKMRPCWGKVGKAGKSWQELNGQARANRDQR